jgi:hypothetical protein
MCEKIKARKLKFEKGERVGPTIEDCLIESDKLIRTDSIDGKPTEFDRPLLPEEFDDLPFDNMSGIGLPNGKFLFYCRFRPQNFIKRGCKSVCVNSLPKTSQAFCLETQS